MSLLKTRQFECEIIRSSLTIQNVPMKWVVRMIVRPSRDVCSIFQVERRLYLQSFERSIKRRQVYILSRQHRSSTTRTGPCQR